MAFLPLLIGAVSAVGALAQGGQQAAELQGAANIADYNATVAEANARAAGQQASAEEERLRRDARQTMGAQRAAMGESGTTVNFGSNLDLQRQSGTAAELDALNIQYEGEVRRGSLLNEAKAQRYNAKTARKSASSIKKTRWLSAIGAGAEGYAGAGGKSFFGAAPGKG